MVDLKSAATRYQRDVHAAQRGSVDGEPEAQLTAPVSELIRVVAEYASLGELTLVRESRLDRTRPDFAVLHKKGRHVRQRGFIELKAPDLSVDTSTWKGRNAKQWEVMKREAEVLVVCNGIEARLYQDGELVGTIASLPYDDAAKWDPSSLVRLLTKFLEATPTPITSVKDLSERLAHRTADLRDRLLWLLDQPSEAGNVARGGHAAWKAHVHPESSARDFADGVSQVVAYGMVLAALSDLGADADDDGYISVTEARQAIRGISPVMAAAFAPLVDKPALFEAVQVELGALETLISAIDPEKVNRSADRRGEPWLYFYEDFLSIYDPEERRQAGVYYTPTAVVKAMVRIVDHLLVERFGLRLGFADPGVVTLDPATGTGTFPLTVIDLATDRVEQLRGKAGRAHAAKSLSKNLYGFELLPGPYAVSHLRLTQRFRSLDPQFKGAAQVVLTDTLETPLGVQAQLTLFGDAEVLAEEQNRAKRIKKEQRVTVVIGNPPYRRVKREVVGRGCGGWVIDGEVPGRRSNKSLFDDILDIGRKNGLGVHLKNAYNLYVYFWRWALWKAFEAHGEGPAVVAFITGSSWLTGPAFAGLRQIVRELCDEAWVLDLGGDNRGANPEENVFAIETPVSIAVLVRDGKTDRKQPAKVHYRRVSGSAADKLQSMAELAELSDPLAGKWMDSPVGAIDSLTPVEESSVWSASVPLDSVFPWMQPGAQFKRLWPISPHRDTLKKRWGMLTNAPDSDKSKMFRETRDRKIDGCYPMLGGVDAEPVTIQMTNGASPQPRICRYGYRSFERQWVFADNRLGDYVVGVLPEVWSFEVSGMPVVKKWLGYRTLEGAGRSKGSGNPLDEIRPTTWPDEWNDELLDLLRVLTLTVQKNAEQADILDRICKGKLISVNDLPKPKPAERKPPKGD